MTEAERIIRACCSCPNWHGSTTADIVDEIMDSCGGQIMCRGRLREFKFSKITDRSYTFKTVDWYASQGGHESNQYHIR